MPNPTIRCEYCGKKLDEGHVIKHDDGLGAISHYACTDCMTEHYSEEEIEIMYADETQYFTSFDE